MAENEEYQPIGRGRSRRSALSSPTKLDDDKQGMEPLGRSRGRAKRSLILSRVSAHYPGEPADAPLSSVAVMTKPKSIQAGGDLVGTGLEPSSAAKSIGVSQSDADTRIRSSSNRLTSSQDVLNIGKRMSSLDIDARKVSPPGVQTSRRSTRGGTSAELGNVEKGGPRQKQAIRSTVWTKPKDMISKKGTAGQVVQLNANYFRLPTVTNWQLYQYRVDFDPEEDRNAMKSRLVREHKAKLGGYLFDGTVLFSPRKYNPDPMIVFSSRPSDNVAMRITIRTVGVLAFGDYHYLHFFNLLMRRCLDNLQLQLVGRYYFDSSAQITVDKHQLELWPGYVTSIRQHENELLLCAEITHKVMRQDTVYTLLKECYSSDSRNFQRLFKQTIVGSIVLTDYNNKTYRIDDVEFSVTPASTFDWNGDETSYVKYYAQKYEMKIQDKSQPMLVSMPKQRDRRRGQNTPIFLVPELCRMTGLSDQMRTNFTLMRDLADCTRLGPSQRMERLQHFNRRLRTNSLVSEELKSWNMEMSESLLALSGRIMPREKIILGSQVKCEAGSMNDWTKELRMHPMLITQEMDSWVVIVPSKLKRDVIQFVASLRKAAYSMELRLPDPSYQDLPDDRMASYVEGIGNAMLSCNPRLILLVLPNNRLDRYSAIKKKCCVERPVPTQLILHKNLNKSVMSIATKVAIQINCKIGGAPWTVEIPLNGLMVVGFDVYHDTAQRGMSIGALVASLDRPMSRYFSAVSYHQTGEELSNELSANICKALQKYTEYNHGCLPQRIVIYRDGVGEGQIPYVFEHEVAILKAKLAQIYAENECKMAFIIVTKRIHTRIFCDGNNPPPGTVVDDVITLPERYDFFLVSQSVRQGTVSPTSYNVISDNVGLDPDKLQRLTYKLTHLYFNWSGTVRVPAPCQYAHKLAYLVGQALHKTPSSRLEDVLYFL